MNVLDAASHLVHDRAHGGAAGLAPRMGKTHQALSAEVAGKPGFKFGLEDAVTAQRLTGKKLILHAMAAELDEMCVPLPSCAVLLSTPCGATVAEAAQKFAALMQEVAVGLADNRVTDNEKAEIIGASTALIAGVHAVMKHVTAMNEELHRLQAKALSGSEVLP